MVWGLDAPISMHVQPGTPFVSYFFRQLETPKTSNYCLQNRTLGFPGMFYVSIFQLVLSIHLKPYANVKLDPSSPRKWGDFKDVLENQHLTFLTSSKLSKNLFDHGDTFEQVIMTNIFWFLRMIHPCMLALHHLDPYSKKQKTWLPARRFGGDTRKIDQTTLEWVMLECELPGIPESSMRLVCLPRISIQM